MTKILQVKSQNQKNVILKILEDDNSTTYHTFDDYDNENILVDGLISFEAMAKIVDYLRLKIKHGSWYKCVKDVMDNKCEVRLFTKDEYYLCPKDGILVTDNNKTMQWQEWHHPEDCFIEENPVTYTRTDAFIEKACQWLYDNLHWADPSDFLEDFGNYMKGE